MVLSLIQKEPYDRPWIALLCLIPFVDLYYVLKLKKFRKFTILTLVIIPPIVTISVLYDPILSFTYLIIKGIQIAFIYRWITRYNFRIFGYESKEDWKVDNFDSIFEEEVYEKLVSKGYEVHTRVPHSGCEIDLAIVHPNDPKRYVLGIECVGTTYHYTRDTTENDDTIQQNFLDFEGCPIETIQRKDWWKNSSNEIKKIEQKINTITCTS